jgi:hypothetical protein
MIVADNLIKSPAHNHSNYWSLLSCLVDDQETDKNHPLCNKTIATMTTSTASKQRNKIAAKWVQKIAICRMGIMDTGATSGAAAKHNIEAMENIGQPSSKVFMLPDMSRIRATHKMLLKHNLREGAREMNVVPGLHSTLVSIPKMADADYIVEFDKSNATIYDATTTTITSLADPVVVAHRCKTTGLWKLDLDAGTHDTRDETNIQATDETVNAIFDLPNNQQTMLYYHASAGFPTKESFLDAVRAGNYATWPGLTTAIISKHFLDSGKTQKGHMKGQCQGVRSTKQKALEHIVTREQHIKIEPGTEDSPKAQIKQHDNIFIWIVDLGNTIHSDQTGAFPFISQRGNRYIMEVIHINANYIFCKPMRNKTEDEMITAYQKILN